MDFINKRVQLFQKLVINHFEKTYCLNTVFQLRFLQPKSMYVNNNCILVHNSVLNQTYNLNEKNYTESEKKHYRFSYFFVS
jgi:hypothetical protein